jgi:hypothetical protein
MTTTKYEVRPFGLLGVLFALSFILPTLLLAQSDESTITIEDNSTAVESVEVEAASMPVVATTLPYVVEKLSSADAVGDFVVGPGRIELEIKPGESKTVEVFISNRISDDRIFELSVEDIAGSSDGRQAVILLGEERGPYTVVDYISLPVKAFPLSLGERARIPVTISIPPNAEPGGFYGSVLVSTTQVPDPAVQAVAQSPIIARIGTLFFVRVPGEATVEGKAMSMSILPEKLWYESGPLRFHILYENTGSVHLNPYGEIRIRNIFGEEVGYFELDPWFSLPKSLRTREVDWNREVLLGRYTATAYINRGYDDIVDEVSVVFYVLPWKIMLGLFLVVFIIVFGFRFFFRTFEFKRRGS